IDRNDDALRILDVLAREKCHLDGARFVLLRLSQRRARQRRQRRGVGAGDVFAGRADEQRVKESPLAVLFQKRARLAEQRLGGLVFGTGEITNSHGILASLERGMTPPLCLRDGRKSGAGLSALDGRSALTESVRMGHAVAQKST